MPWCPVRPACTARAAPSVSVRLEVPACEGAVQWATAQTAKLHPRRRRVPRGLPIETGGRGVCFVLPNRGLRC